jgi:type IV secretory pathway VirJ component
MWFSPGASYGVMDFLLPELMLWGKHQNFQWFNLGTAPLTVYRQSSQPSHVVLFVSGDGGWNLGVVEMARELASLDAKVDLQDLPLVEVHASIPGKDVLAVILSGDGGWEGAHHFGGHYEAIANMVLNEIGQ